MVFPYVLGKIVISLHKFYPIRKVVSVHKHSSVQYSVMSFVIGINDTVIRLARQRCLHLWERVAGFDLKGGEGEEKE